MNVRSKGETLSEVEIVTLIHTRLLRRGQGVEGDPIRIVDQWWTLDGELVFERDEWGGENQ